MSLGRRPPPPSEGWWSEVGGAAVDVVKAVVDGVGGGVRVVHSHAGLAAVTASLRNPRYRPVRVQAQRTTGRARHRHPRPVTFAVSGFARLSRPALATSLVSHPAGRVRAARLMPVGVCLAVRWAVALPTGAAAGAVGTTAAAGGVSLVLPVVWSAPPPAPRPHR